MIAELSKSIKQVEVTDDLIALNKEYQKLNDAYDKCGEVIDILMPMKGTEKEVKILNQQQNILSKKADEIYRKVKEGVFLQRMIKGALALKALKEV